MNFDEQMNCSVNAPPPNLRQYQVVYRMPTWAVCMTCTVHARSPDEALQVFFVMHGRHRIVQVANEA